jgi:GTPase involved in cell partitioning and DNA repair
MELVNANEERQKQIYNELKLLQEEYSNYIISLVGETEWTKINLMDSAAEAAKELMA